MENGKKPIKSYRDLDIYKNLYQAMLIVLKKIIPRLPKEERYDLVDQMRRCCKSSPSLIAEGFAKRYQIRSWRKYLEDAIGEINEMMHHLSVCSDIYSDYLDKKDVEEVLRLYEISARQCYRLKESWQDFHEKRQY